MSVSSPSDSGSGLNWTAIAALYAGLVFGVVVMLSVGQYRNAAWLGLLGFAGGCTAYARVLERRGREAIAKRWKWTSGVVYGVFFLWVGTVFLQTLFG